MTQVKGLQADTAENDIFETRPSFLHFCQENHYQFGTLRRAKHSSMMILYHLHKQVPLTTGRTCSICLRDILELAGWCCDTCPNFDVCNTCYNENSESCHSHKLIPISPEFECGINKYRTRQQRVFQLQVIFTFQLYYQTSTRKACLCFIIFPTNFFCCYPVFFFFFFFFSFCCVCCVCPRTSR